MQIKSRKTLLITASTLIVLATAGVSYALVQPKTSVKNDTQTTVSQTETPSPSPTPSVETSPTPTTSPVVSTTPTPSVTPAPQATAQATHDQLIAQGYTEHDYMCFDLMATKRGWYSMTQDAVNTKIGVFKTRGFDICVYWYDVVSRNTPFYPLATGL